MKQAFWAWSGRPDNPNEITAPHPHTLAHSSKDIGLSCGNCSHVCAPDPEERKRRLKMLEESGVVIQVEDGTLKAVSPTEAEEYLAGLDSEIRAYYEPSDPEALADIPVFGGNKTKRTRPATSDGAGDTKSGSGASTR
jgi:hypothetical protein